MRQIIHGELYDSNFNNLNQLVSDFSDEANERRNN